MMFNLVGTCLKEKGFFFCYGPFNQNGEFTSPSNQAFDTSLRQQNPNMGLRDLNDVEKEANKNQLELKKIHYMPANNMLLVFKNEKDL